MVAFFVLENFEFFCISEFHLINLSVKFIVILKLGQSGLFQLF